MKRRVCCFLLAICILALPVEQAYAAPAGPAEKAEEAEKKLKPHEKAEAEKPKPHECKHEHDHEHPVPPHEKEHEHPLLPHEHVHEHVHEHPKPEEEKNGPLAEKPVPPHEKEKQEAEDKQPENTPSATPTTAPTVAPTATPVPTATPKPSAVPTVAPTETPKQEEEDTTTVTSVDELVQYALQFVGNPYKYGGSSLTNGADCSGFVQSVYAHFGYSLDRTSKAQAASTQYMQVEAKESELLPGDLIFYANSQGSVYHVAIYIGDGKIVHSSNARKEITVSEYNGIKPYKARRIIT